MKNYFTGVNILRLTQSLGFILLAGLLSNCSSKQPGKIVVSAPPVVAQQSSSATRIPAGTINGELPPERQYKDCILPGGKIVQNLESLWGLQNSPSDNKSCDLFEVRRCFDGHISPSSGVFTSESCSVQLVNPTTQAASCNLNGKVYQHGESVIAFNDSIVDEPGNCIGQVRMCKNGTFSGSDNYSNLTCGLSSYVPASGKNYACTFNDLTVGDGSFVIAFLDPSPTGKCDFELRSCIQGRLSGSFTYSTCTPLAQAN